MAESFTEKQKAEFPQAECDYEAKLRGDEFVGLKFENGKLLINFPLGYRKGSTQKEERKDILNLISVLSSFSERKDSFYTKANAHNESNVEFPIHAYLFIINNFLNNGYYTERETVYKKSAGEKINWNRTIKQIRPQIADGNVVYLEFVTQKTNHNQAELITLIHKYCVYESFSKIGFLFSSFMPQKSTLKFNANLFKSVLQSKLAETFNEKDLLLFKNMLEMINYIDSSGEEKTFYYGTEHFEHVWENLVDCIFGESDKEKFYPKCHWFIEGSGEQDYSADTYKKYSLRPDSIMIVNRGKPEQKIYVLDSKYYRYALSGNKYDLPGTDSIIKQIAYAEFIETLPASLPNDVKTAPLNKDKIYNAFIFPADLTEKNYALKKFGYAYTDYKEKLSKKSYHKIYGILLDVKSVMHTHIQHDESAIAELARVIDGV